MGGFYYRFLIKSPLGDLGVKMFYVCLTLILLEIIITGKAVSQNPENHARTIKIGLLVQDSTYTSALHGAEMAIKNANEKGGLRGQKFQLVFRSMEGPWGTGSKQAVNLIFDEKVWALIGFHDGRNAHLVEQAATKSTVVLISAWSGDPTLSQAFVPWFFNCVPNDRQQALSLFEDIYNKHKFRNIVVISGKDYDSRLAADNFMKTVKTSGKQDPLHFSYDEYNQHLNLLTDKIARADANCIVLFCKPSASKEIVNQLKIKKIKIPLYGSLMILDENELTAREIQEYDNILFVPSGDWSGPENLLFFKEYHKTYNKMPGMAASFAYDGTNLLIEAIKTAGTNDREMIQKSLKQIRYKGTTGLIQFDDKGNRMGKFEIMKTMNGLPTTGGNKIPRLRSE